LKKYNCFILNLNAMRYFRWITSLSIIFIFSSLSLKAQLAKKYAGYGEYYYKGLRYGLFMPAGYDPGKSYPMIVYMHGSRDTVSRDLGWYQPVVQREHPCFVLTPKCEVSDQGWGNTWKEGYTTATAKTLGLVDSLVRRYPIDANRLYLYGISMGGFGVFSVLAKEKGKFAAAYSVCGGSDVAAASKLTGTPLWIFHGANDDIVPVSLSRDTYKEIVRLGGRTVRYTEYSGVKHNSWENVSQEKSLGTWLFAQRKGQTSEGPSQVNNLRIGKLDNTGILLTWDKPGKEVWYYKLLKDGALLAEIEGGTFTYSDPNGETGKSHTYSLIAVNYFFQESKPVAVKIAAKK
jgi:poly(3-hydroxybutyrate) depolymerase